MRDAIYRHLARSIRRLGQAAARWASRMEQCRPLTSEQSSRLSHNAAFENRHSGRPAFVIGNGKSLAKMDLGPLADEVTFVSNGFWRHPLMAETYRGGEEWQPTYYSIVDPIYFDGSLAMTACFERIRARASRSRFLIPYSVCSRISSFNSMPSERILPLVFRNHLATAPSCSWNLSRPIPGVQSVSLVGIMAALYMGCRPIYLLGMDHDWLASPDGRCEHFYVGPSVEGHPEVQAIEFDGATSYLANLEAMSALYRSYARIQDAAASAGVKIMNATEGGFLDVFPRTDYRQIVDAIAPRKRTRSMIMSQALDSVSG